MFICGAKANFLAFSYGIFDLTACLKFCDFMIANFPINQFTLEVILYPGPIVWVIPNFPFSQALKYKSTGRSGRAHFGKVHSKQPLSRKSSDSRFTLFSVSSIRSGIFPLQNFFTNPKFQSFGNWPVKFSWKMSRYTS